MEKKKLLEYLKNEFGINSEEEFLKEYKKFKGLDISLFVEGSEIINENQVEKCS